MHANHHHRNVRKCSQYIGVVLMSAVVVCALPLLSGCTPLNAVFHHEEKQTSSSVQLPQRIASSCEEIAHSNSAHPENAQAQLWYAKQLQGKDLQAFLAMQQAIERRESSVQFPDNITESNVTKAHTALRLDCPDLYNVEMSQIKMMVDDSTHNVSSMDVVYTMEDEEYQQTQQKIDAIVQPLLDSLKGKNAYEQEIAIHDWLAQHITYDVHADHAGDIVGSLINGRAKCDGYSAAFTYLMNKVGVPAIQITGNANNGKQDEGHAWNAVQLDDGWYYVDVTWDDMDAHVDEEGQVNLPYTYSFFNVPYDVIAQTHTPSKDMDALGTMPKDNLTTYYYYLRNGDVVHTQDEAREKIAQAITECTTVPIKFDNKEQYEQFRNNIRDIVQNVANEVGAGGFNYRSVTDDAGWLVIFSVQE